MWIILALSFLVIIHELGHFLAARWSKIKVEEFGVGYPPRAVKLFKHKETLFSLNWIPFGGFVRIEGEDEVSGYFNKFPIPKRLLVILSGAIVNFLFGILAFALIFSLTGIPTPIEEARIGLISPDSPAAEAGLPAEVNIIAFELNEETTSVANTQEVIDYIDAHKGENVTVITTGHCEQLACQEMAGSYQVYLRTDEETPDDQGSLGIVFQGMIYQQYPWYEMPFRGAWYGLVQAFWLGGVILMGLWQILADLFTGHGVPSDVAGPVGIVHLATQENIAQEGFLAMLSFTGMLSINLAVMNLLPIPALDGGRALFIILEKFTGRKKIEKIENLANYGGYIILLTLIILITIKDVFRIFN